MTAQLDLANFNHVLDSLKYSIGTVSNTVYMPQDKFNGLIQWAEGAELEEFKKTKIGNLLYG